ncbi:Inositol-1,4,5-trisphosphate 5-phosphatase 1 [Rhodotorula kratochvilovae]
MEVPLQLWLIRHPTRTLALVNSDWALLFRSPPRPASPASNDVSVVVELLPRDDVDLEVAALLHSRVSGCLGVLSVGSDTFLPIITHATSLGATYDRPFGGPGTEPVNRILAVDFFCLTSPSFDYLHAPSLSSTAADPNGVSGDYLDDSPSSSSASSLRSEPAALEHPCQGIRKILSNSSFYFSSGPDAFDLSTRLQARLDKLARTAQDRSGGAEGEIDDEPNPDGYEAAALDHDSRFLWNTYLVAPLLSFRASLPPHMRDVFDRQAFMVLAIQGYVDTYDINLGGEPAVLSLVSRLGWKRSGTRFNVRGVDDDGGVANFAETETILRTRELCFSFVQTRGSVPLFWEEGGGQPFNPKITITRPIEASLPAFVRHFEDLLEHYGSLHAINLLGSKEGEAALTAAYEAHLAAAAEADENIAHEVGMTPFDFHHYAKVGGIESVKSHLLRAVGEVEDRLGACVVGVGEAGEVTPILSQRGVFRTNCKGACASPFSQCPPLTFYPQMYCLDRTNAVEDSLSRFALEDFLRSTQPHLLGPSAAAALWASHRVLWADNGDALSKIYVGTGAINTSFTRTGKKSLAGMLSDASKSVNRVFQQQLFDGGKQKAIDALLGNLATSRKVRIFNPIHDTLRAQLRTRAAEFTSHEPATLWVGTYNLNGKAPGAESLLPWLFPVEGPDPALLVIGFQEIVPLSPQQIMSTDPEKKRRWEAHILQTLADRPGKKSDYVLLRSGQLVGTALIVLCKREVAGEVRNVEAATKKTGVRGLAGNKGAVAIRLDYRNTSFCFLTAHLAAGHSNVEERNQDYRTIAEGLHFARGKTIANHDNVVWAADTNYRISLPNDEVRAAAEDDDYDVLCAADQLQAAMRTRGVFAGYQEAPLLFRPTYKYDNGTDTYDSSEKMRVPAYTDRILYKGADLDCFRYQRAELRTSDHRPVYALFRARIRTVDQSKRAALRKQLLQELLAHPPEETLDDKLSRLTVGTAVGSSKELPPPSDDEQAWWNEPDGSFVPPKLPPRPGNPAVSNPFAPDFYLPSAPSTSSTPLTGQPASQRRAPPAVPQKPTRPPAPTVKTGDLVDLSDLVSSTSPLPAPAPAAPPSAFHAVRRKPAPPASRSASPAVSLSDAAPPPPPRAKDPPPVPQRPGQANGPGKEGSLAGSVVSEVGTHETGESWQLIS